jgi:3-oxoacyl-[acyl-carrier-protein] synthase II
VDTIYNPKDPIKNYIKDFIFQFGLKPENIDLVLLGKSGDKRLDEEIDKSITPPFESSSMGSFKHLCGEYYTASSFALWLAYSILKKGEAPGFILERNNSSSIKNVLIYNRNFEKHHSLIFLSRDDV